MSPVTTKKRQAEDYKRQAERTIEFLCSTPGTSNTTVTTRTFRSMLLQSDGYVYYEGKRYEIKGKSLGAGVYRVTLEKA